MDSLQTVSFMAYGHVLDVSSIWDRVWMWLKSEFCLHKALKHQITLRIINQIRVTSAWWCERSRSFVPLLPKFLVLFGRKEKHSVKKSNSSDWLNTLTLRTKTNIIYIYTSHQHRTEEELKTGRWERGEEEEGDQRGRLLCLAVVIRLSDSCFLD